MANLIIFVEDEFEDIELLYPLYRLREAGYDVTLVGTGTKYNYTGTHGYIVDVDASAHQIDETNYDGIIIPGGYASYKLRVNDDVKRIVRHMKDNNKLLGVMCEGNYVLISAEVLDGYKVTCKECISDDVINAGGEYIRVGNWVDRNIITAKMQVNLPQFMNDIFEYLNK
ncbi:type 1 glutamine amidotransferase [Clostridium felsineum]|uniref:DJ-1/PfpI/YhbO family deglycase/protease n=1 Tax=Clostridium felsineum TaxID=36839 RepID=UPI00098C462C|nr:DJ-1/PfpI/YhbO family deglycase/protease [Clostridium felsineum]MCR3760085.1 type 1 glutamine amidotransferase [Clostridium felsineum]URZ01375.1 Putative cysteine protease YraA [Clostridium felsineum]URZ15571.1 Putative cysteine protease YraA [Clostridium felsineum DSM 794]